jgi:hypothetical protein
MHQSFTRAGGARVGWVNASWPLARISATAERLSVSVSLLGTYTFSPEQVSAVERYGMIPVLASGIRVRHHVPDYPQGIIFWTLGNPEAVLGGIRDAGFIPAALVSTPPGRRGIPMRWSAMLAAIVAWNALCVLAFGGLGRDASVPEWPVLVPLVAAFALSLGILRSRTLQRLVLKPDRRVGEIRPFLRLLALVGGVLSVIFALLVATGAFRKAPPEAGDAGHPHLFTNGPHHPGPAAGPPT